MREILVAETDASPLRPYTNELDVEPGIAASTFIQGGCVPPEREATLQIRCLGVRAMLYLGIDIGKRHHEA